MNQQYQIFYRIKFSANKFGSFFRRSALLPGLIALLFFVFCSPEFITQPKRLVVKTTTIVRSGPGTKYKEVAKVKSGTQLFLLESQNDWHHVELPDGRRGWIFQGVARQIGGEKVVVVKDQAKVRRGPGEEYSAFAMIKKGKDLVCLGERGNWFLVELIQGRNGWLNKKDAQKVSFRNIVTKKATYAFREANKESGILLNITKGAELIQLGKEKDFYQVRLPGGQVGYIRESDVDVVRERNVRVKDRTVLRRGSNEGYDVVDTLEVGTQITKLSQKGDWVEVKTSSGKTGWIHKSAITTTASTVGEEFIDEKPVYLVTNQDSNIREEAGTNNPKLDRVRKGTLLLKLDQENDWLKIKLPDGRIGWIYEPLTDADVTLLLTKMDCNIRQGPSTKYLVLEHPPRGTPLVRLGEENGWTRIMLEDGRVGWIRNDLRVPLDSLLFANQACNVRGGPGTQYKRLDRIPYGTFVYYLGKTKNWYKIRLIPNKEEQGEIGYIQEDLLDLSGNEFITNERANIRVGPSTDYAIKANLPPRTRLRKIGEKPNWVHVTYEDGKKGWVYKKLVSYAFSPYPGYKKQHWTSSPAPAPVSSSATVAETASISEPLAQTSKPVSKTAPDENSYYALSSTEEEVSKVRKEQIKIGVNLRTDPDTSASIIRQLPVQTLVTKISRSGEWWEVLTEDGIYGWIHQVAFGLPETKYLYAEKNVNIRYGPGTSYKLVATVSRGEVLTRLEKRGNWYNVKLKNGQKGWVREDLVSVQRVSPGILPEFKALPAYGRAITNRNTQLYKGPSREYPVIRRLAINTYLKIIGEYSTWSQVTLMNGVISGWVPNSDIFKKYHSRIIVTQDAAEVYVAPSSQSGLVARVKRAKTFRPLDQRNEWFRIAVGEQTGWINFQNVASLKYPTVYVNQREVNVRRFPNIHSKKIAVLSEGTKLVPSDDEGDWLFVKLPRGDKGWIHKKLVDLQEHPYVIVTSDANVYKEATAGSVLKGIVKKEERYLALDKKPHWYKIPYRTDDVGWVYSGFVKEDVMRTELIRNRSELRMGPGADFELIGYVNKGAQTKLLKQVGNWSQIEVRPGRVGWVHAIETKSMQLGKLTAKIIGSAYKKPNYNSTIVGRVLKGKSYEPFEKRGEFYKIQLSDGVYGWAPTSVFTEKKKKTVFTLDVANLRSGPGPGYGVLQKLEPATDLVVLGTDGQYYHVEIKGTKTRGYILKSMVFE